MRQRFRDQSQRLPLVIGGVALIIQAAEETFEPIGVQESSHGLGTFRHGMFHRAVYWTTHIFPFLDQTAQSCLDHSSVLRQVFVPRIAHRQRPMLYVAIGLQMEGQRPVSKIRIEVPGRGSRTHRIMDRGG